MNGTDHDPEVAGRLVPGAATGRNGRHDRESTTSDLRHLILLALRTNEAQSPEQLALQLGASRTGVLQQLRSLELSGLVTRQTVRHGVGRPRHLYDLTPAAQATFPSNYGPLAENLLEAVNAIGGSALVELVFDARRQELRRRIVERFAERLPAGAPLQDRVRELAVIQDEQGYLGRATVGDDGTLRLCEHNCAVLHVAGRYPAACRAELELFREVLDSEVVRETHIAAGDRSCTYRIGSAELD